MDDDGAKVWRDADGWQHYKDAEMLHVMAAILARCGSPPDPADGGGYVFDIAPIILRTCRRERD